MRYRTDSDEEGIFQAARKDGQVLDELLSDTGPLDMAEEFDFLTYYPRPTDGHEQHCKLVDKSRGLFINGDNLSEVMKHLIKTNETYAKRFYADLINEYEKFNK